MLQGQRRKLNTRPNAKEAQRALTDEINELKGQLGGGAAGAAGAPSGGGGGEDAMAD